MEILQRRLNRTQEFSDIFEPQIFRLSEPADASLIAELLASRADIEVHDEIIGQLRELVKSLNPSRKMTGDLYEELISAHLQGRSPDTYGVWVYYPWNRKLVHLLDESEFVEVRTNRNRYKITRQEQEQLRKAKVGIVGLSVGQSIALTLAMERTCGVTRACLGDSRPCLVAGNNLAHLTPDQHMSITDFTHLKIGNPSLS